MAEFTNENAQALREAFFPAPLEADLSDIESSRSQSQKTPLTFPLISKQELTDAIQRASK